MEATKPTLAAFTILYNQGADKYEQEQTLQPNEQMWMDMGKLIREKVPDKNGKTLPADLISGSYEIRDLTNKGIGTLFEGKVIYDKTYGHVTYGCAACCGWGIPYPWYNPLSVLIQADQANGEWASYPCGSYVDDVSSNFYNNWSSGDTSVVTVDSYGTHTGITVGSTTSQTTGYLSSNDAHHGCPNTYRNPRGPANVTPAVTIDSFSPNPIVGGNTATVHITVTPSANITLTINKSGTGSATFGTSGNTSLQIQETTAVTITGGSESNGGPDLTLQAAYGSTPVIVGYPGGYPFSVTTGACSATYTGHNGDGTKNCPTAVSVNDTYSLKEYCSGCTFTCIPLPNSYDSTFTPTGCGSVTSGVQGAGNQSLISTQTGNFAATDCSYHYLQIKTTVTSAEGIITPYTGGSIGLKCTKYPNGSLCP